ncbi:MAG TPA: hypothetical protein VGM84_06790 [Steroidobacteraceae bacterium]|jgi:hypothetical protein
MIAFRAVPLWVLASAALAMTACGGGTGSSGGTGPSAGGISGGSSSGSGSSGGGSSTAPPSTPPAGGAETPAQIVAAVAALEANGTLPILDVSDSLGGTDANNNGIRDDIEAYISKQSDSTPQRAALQQVAKALQSTLLLDTSNAPALAAAATAVRRGVACVWSTYDPTNAHDRNVRMQQLTVNTMPRLVAYEKFNTAMDGTVITDDPGASCD